MPALCVGLLSSASRRSPSKKLFFFSVSSHKKTHTHTDTVSRTRSSLSYNSVWKSNLILAALMNIHPHLLPAETFQQVPLPLRQEFGPGLLCVLARTSTPCTTCAHYSAAVVSVGLMRSDSRYLLLIFFFFVNKLQPVDRSNIFRRIKYITFNWLIF